MPETRIQALGEWMAGTVLPMWTRHGVSPRSGLPFEALDAGGAPLQGDFHRVLSIARQAFFLLRMQRRTAADCAQQGLAYVDRLHHSFMDPASGTFPFTVDARGAPLEARRELYTHAFVVLAYAEAYRHTRQDRYLDWAERLLQAIHRHFLKPGAAAYSSALGADLDTELVGQRQNPHMHLFEAVAWLALASGDEGTKARLDALAALILRVFGAPDVPAVLELPVGAADNRVEAGHQAEWFSLVHIARPVLALPGLSALADHAFAAVREKLLARDFTFPLSATPGLEPLDSTRRIWTQLELVRALALLRATGSAAPELEQSFDALTTKFLRPHGWVEAVDAQGAVVRGEMPATTPYHLVTCLDALAPV